MRHICYVRQKVRCANEHVEVDGGGKFIAVFGAVSIVVVGVCRRKSSSPHNMGYACVFFLPALATVSTNAKIQR